MGVDARKLYGSQYQETWLYFCVLFLFLEAFPVDASAR